MPKVIPERTYDLKSSFRDAYKNRYSSQESLYLWARFEDGAPTDLSSNNHTISYDGSPPAGLNMSVSEVRKFLAVKFGPTGSGTGAKIQTTSGEFTFSTVADGGNPNTGTDLPFSIGFWSKNYGPNGVLQYAVSKQSSNNSGETYTIATGTLKDDQADGQWRAYATVELVDEYSAGDATQTATRFAPIGTNPSDWHYWVFTYDGRGGAEAYLGLSVYCNGTNSESSHAGQGEPLYVGVQPGHNDQLYIGSWADGNYEGDLYMSELAIWSTELTDEEVAAIYNVSIAGNPWYSGILNTPPRLLIQELDHATGSYPTIFRAGDADRQGKFLAPYQDQDTVTFRSPYATANIDFISLPRDTMTIKLWTPVDPPDRDYNLNYSFATTTHAYTSEDDCVLWLSMTDTTTPTNNAPSVPTLAYEGTRTVAPITLGNKSYPASLCSDSGAQNVKVTLTSLSFSDCVNSGTPVAGDDNPFSISIWVYIDVLESYQALFGKQGVTTSKQEYDVDVDVNGAVAFELTDEAHSGASQGTWTANGVITAQKWHHCVFTYDGRGGAHAKNGMRTYIDGEFMPASTVISNNGDAYVGMQPKNTAPLYIGAKYTGNDELDGKIAEFAAWSKELSADEIRAIYDATRGAREHRRIEGPSEVFEFNRGVLTSDSNTEVPIPYRQIKTSEEAASIFARIVQASALKLEAQVRGNRVILEQNIPGASGNSSIVYSTNFPTGSSSDPKFRGGSDHTVAYPTALPADHRHIQDIIVTPNQPSDIAAYGKTKSGVSDTNIRFTPGEGLSAFNDSRISLSDPEVEEFYAEGTSESVLPGFSQRLANKTILTFDLSTEETTSLFFSTGSNTGPAALQGCPTPYGDIGSNGSFTVNHPTWPDAQNAKLILKCTPTPTDPGSQILITCQNDEDIGAAEFDLGYADNNATAASIVNVVNGNPYTRSRWRASANGATVTVYNIQDSVALGHISPLFSTFTAASVLVTASYGSPTGFSEISPINSGLSYFNFADKKWEVMGDLTTGSNVDYFAQETSVATGSMLAVIPSQGWGIGDGIFNNEQLSADVGTPTNFAGFPLASKFDATGSQLLSVTENMSVVKPFLIEKIELVITASIGTEPIADSGTEQPQPSTWMLILERDQRVNFTNHDYVTSIEPATGLKAWAQFDFMSDDISDYHHRILTVTSATGMARHYKFSEQNILDGSTGTTGGTINDTPVVVVQLDGIIAPNITDKIVDEWKDAINHNNGHNAGSAGSMFDLNDAGTHIILTNTHPGFAGNTIVYANEGSSATGLWEVQDIDPSASLIRFSGGADDVVEVSTAHSSTRDRRIIWYGRVSRFRGTPNWPPYGDDIRFTSAQHISSINPSLGSSADLWIKGNEEIAPGGAMMNAPQSLTFTLQGSPKTPTQASIASPTYKMRGYNSDASNSSLNTMRMYGRPRGGRNLRSLSDGRSIIRGTQGSQVLGFVTSNNLDVKKHGGAAPLEVPFYDTLINDSPFLLLPGDKLILAVANQPMPYTIISPYADEGRVAGSHEANPPYGYSGLYNGLKVKFHPGHARLSLYGSLVKEGREVHEGLNQPLTSDAIHEAATDGIILDQWDVEPASSFVGSYIDEAVAGDTSLHFSGSQTVETPNSEGNVSLDYSSDEPGYRGVYGNFSKGTMGVTGSLMRGVVLSDESERYYDSMMPDLGGVWEVDDKEFLAYGDFVVAYMGSNYYSNLNPTNWVNQAWTFAFPFESRYNNVSRIVGLVGTTVVTPNNSTVKLPIKFAGIYFFDVDDFDDDGEIGDAHVFHTADEKQQGVGNLGDVTNKSIKATQKLLFGSWDTSGPLHRHVPDEGLIHPAGGYGTCGTKTPIWGWKYGISNTFPQFSRSVFRRDKYGQLRDMLEQRKMTRYQVGESTLGGAVFCRFFDYDGKHVSPEQTHCQNLNNRSTSSMPFFDMDGRLKDTAGKLVHIGKNRDTDPDDIELLAADE